MLQQRMTVIALTIAMLAGIAVTIELNQQTSRKRLAREFPRLGEKDRVFLHHDIRTFSYSPASSPITDEVAARYFGRTPALNVAWEVLESGNRQWEAGHQKAAILQWHAVAEKYRGTDAALAALSHIGQSARSRGDLKGAANAYTSLVESPDPPKHDGPGLFYSANYKHRACVELSDIYIDMHDTRNAHKYADLALNVHSISDMCGMYVTSVNSSLEDRIQSLRQAFEHNHTIRLIDGQD